eukprot:CAMPEP_0184374822 /NCGR_PEP_ID=MMETSP1089-20130417/165231_1 /TAXON_ID=38269 ORGANISM="Gloeochaete wittrockiana, Strain SAG46.84" /NCGR_SAMPLE_ID=MMETSP1089 /ASSEMBLY_ACC=CAM_ASM_000445 /LENGTH=142 /DNA_ID=CAMNT_0026717857 /DNA_START=455 /DNA_END=883 /DNA_ORIENTATION=+
MANPPTSTPKASAAMATPDQFPPDGRLDTKVSGDTERRAVELVMTMNARVEVVVVQELQQRSTRNGLVDEGCRESEGMYQWVGDDAPLNSHGAMAWPFDSSTGLPFIFRISAPWACTAITSIPEYTSTESVVALEHVGSNNR